MLHQPVLLQKILDFLESHEVRPKSIIDGTFGRGGHTIAFLDRYKDSKVVGFDRDEEAIAYGYEKYASWLQEKRLYLIQDNFVNVYNHGDLCRDFFGGTGPDLALLDLGVSSPQLDNSERGFSFYKSGPLDMRMDRSQSLSAYEIVNTWPEKNLSDLFYHLGEIKFPNKVVRTIVAKRQIRPIETTDELAELISASEGWRKKGKHPATQYFLALRIQVNEELNSVREALESLLKMLVPGGYLMVISFHSTEDRIVKNLFKSFASDYGKILTKKVIQAEGLEIEENPRARSAKLRIFQREGV